MQKNNFFARGVESISSAKWHLHKFVSQTIYVRAFGKFGNASSLIAPLKLKGVQKIFIGNEVVILEGAWLQTEAAGKLTIGDNTYIGNRCHLHAVSDVTVGADCVLADNVMINSGVHDPKDLWNIITKGPINIGNNVFIGQNVSILSGVTICDRAVIGAGAVVTKDVPADTAVVGIPAKPLK